MNTGSKLALAGVALIASTSALPAAAAPIFFGNPDAPFVVASRDNGEFRAEPNPDERRARKPEKQLRKDTRKDERRQERGSDEPGYGYGYERRYPNQPNPNFDDRGRR